MTVKKLSHLGAVRRTRIPNHVTPKHTSVDSPATRIRADIAKLLQDEVYSHGFDRVDDGAHPVKGIAPVKTPRLFLKYGPHGEKLITGVERISRPGRRVYFGREDVPEVLAGLGTAILTTSRGVMTGREAIKAGGGGGVLWNVWYWAARRL